MSINKKGVTVLREVEEGPYYKHGSPHRECITGEGTYGNRLIVEGRVLDVKGQLIPNAWVDIWQADGRGHYDNAGFNLRGHQYTDEEGKYHFETVMPALYGNRTPHIHIKVQANPRSKTYTTQLYFPEMKSNEKDPLFEQVNVMKVTESAEGTQVTYDLVVEVTD